MAGPDPDIRGLLAWAAEKGVVLHPSLEVRGRTLTAVAEIQPGVAITIPSPCLLTAALAPTHRDYGPHFPAGLPDRDALCLVLLAEACAGGASPWAPYIASLPRTYSDPTWWCVDDASLLSGSRLGASADAAWAHVLRLTAAANALEAARLAAGAGPGPLSDAAVRAGDPAIPQLEAVAAARGWTGTPGASPWGLSPAGAAWARSTVWSRAFNLPPVGSGAAALLPVADLMDHDPSAAVAWWMEGGDGGGSTPDTFTWAARAPVAAGSPLMMNYSPFKSTEELIAGYGFALPSNPADFFHVSLGVKGRDTGAAARAAALLRSAGLPRDVFMRAADPLPRSALAAAAVLLADPAFAAGLEAALGGCGPPPAASSPPRSPPTAVEVGPRPPPDLPTDPPRVRGACDLGLPAPPATQLAAVKSLRAALRARVGQLGGGGRGGGSASAAGLRAAAAEDDAASASASAAGRRHAAMAHAYLAGQRRLAAAALERLEGWAAAVVAAGAEAAADLGLVESTSTGGEACAEVGAAAAPGSSLAPRWGWGLHTRDSPTPAGTVLVDVPAAEVVRFADREAAVAALAAAAAGLGLVPPGAPPPPDPACPPELARRLLSAVPPPVPVTVLMGGPEAGAAGGLDGTPAGDALSAELEEASAGGPAATLARAWAGAVVDRAAWPGPGGSGVALVPVAWSVPPAVRGVAADLEWNEASSGARLVAACALPPSTTLCRALELPSMVAGDVVTDFGPSALALLGAPLENALHLTLGGPCPALQAFEVDVAPDEPPGGPVTTLLDAAGLGGPHWLAAGPTAAGRARRLVAALAVMGGGAGVVEGAGAARLCAARTAAAAAWASAPESGRDDAVKADAAADAEARAFVAALLSRPEVAAAAARAARAVLAGERAALVAEGAGGGGDAAAKGAALYRAGLVAALDAALEEVGAALKEAKRAGGADGKRQAKKKAKRNM